VKDLPKPSRRAYRSALMAMQTRARGGRPALDRYRHRYELYLRAAPVFRTFGYRQVTMKALAHACGVTPPALYRYFPSKLEFALFPLTSAASSYCVNMLSDAASRERDPVRALRAVLETAIAEVELLVLAMQLAQEAELDDLEVPSTHGFAGPETALGNILLQCVPLLGDRARDLAHTLVALVIAAASEKRPIASEAFWRQSGMVVRAYLLRAGVGAADFEEVFPESASS